MDLSKLYNCVCATSSYFRLTFKGYFRVQSSFNTIEMFYFNCKVNILEGMSVVHPDIMIPVCFSVELHFRVGLHGRDRLVVGFTTTYSISSYYN